MARNDQEITLAAAELESLMKQVSTLYIQAAEVIGNVQGLASPSELESLLSVRSNLDREEVRALTFLGRMMDDSIADLKGSAFTLETIKLLHAASPELRQDALQYLRKNKRLDASDFKQVEQRLTDTSTPDWECREASRDQDLSAVISDRVDALKLRVDELQSDLRGFTNRYVGDPWEDDFLYQDFDDYSKDFNAICAAARRILEQLENLIGNVDSGIDSMRAESKLGVAAKALARLADGEFAHNGGFGFDTERPRYWSNDLHDAIGYLTTHRSDQTEPNTWKGRLQVLELCAGGGGSAIGLMSAGFNHVALVENDEKRVETLRKNWPKWKVLHQDLEAISPEIWKRYTGIDMLAVGLPSSPGKRLSTKPDLMPLVLDIVDLVGPRSLILQFDKGQRQTDMELNLAPVLVRLQSQGYRTFNFVLDTANFGLPHSREHEFIVGVRNEIVGAFLDPSSITPIKRNVGAALSPIVAKHKTLDRTLPLDDPQRIYNIWANQWYATYKDARLPTLLRQPEKGESRGAWLEAGLDPSEIGSDVPEVGDPALRSRKFTPFVTAEILAAAQGFPQEWKFAGKKSGVLGTIVDALPPVMAKAVGLSVRALLNRETVDLDRAITQPVINTSRIGLGKLVLNLNALGRNEPGDWDDGIDADDEPNIASPHPLVPVP